MIDQDNRSINWLFIDECDTCMDILWLEWKQGGSLNVTSLKYCTGNTTAYCLHFRKKYYSIYNASTVEKKVHNTSAVRKSSVQIPPL